MFKSYAVAHNPPTYALYFVVFVLFIVTISLPYKAMFLITPFALLNNPQLNSVFSTVPTKFIFLIA